MNKTAGHMMGYMGLMDDDAKMLCKVLEISAAQALALKKKIAMGHKLPSWAEYKIYKAGDALKSATASTHSMRDHMPKITIAIKSGPSIGSALPSNMQKQARLIPKTGIGNKLKDVAGTAKKRLKNRLITALGGTTKGGVARAQLDAVKKHRAYMKRGPMTKKAWAKIAIGKMKVSAARRDPRLERAGVSGYNKPKRTPGHSTKSHIVVAKEGDRVKTIRFGQQGVKTNQTAGQRKAFKSETP